MADSNLILLKNPNDVLKYLHEIQLASDRNRNELGFWRPNTLRELVLKGRVWVVVNSSAEYFGHTLFGGGFPVLKIFQLYVQPERRRSGVAGFLIENLRNYGEKIGYLEISARVASDLSIANSTYSAFGFELVRVLDGGTSRNRKINLRVLRLNTPSLFDEVQPVQEPIEYETGPMLQTPSYVIDLNIVMDLVKPNRPERDSAIAVFRSAMTGDIRLFAAPELTAELLRNHKPNRPDPILEFANTLSPLPPVNNLNLEKIRLELEKLVFVEAKAESINDQSDLRHLATCIHHKIHGFITRDTLLLSAHQRINSRYGLNIVAPGEFYAEPIDSELRLIAQLPEPGSSLEIGDFVQAEQISVDEFFIQMGIDNRDAGNIWSPGSNNAPRRRIVAATGTQVIGIATYDRPPDALSDSVAFLIVNELNPAAEICIDHLLEQISRDHVYRRTDRILLTIRREDERSISTAHKRGYRTGEVGPGGSRFTTLAKLSFRPLVSDSNWAEFRKAFAKNSGYSFAKEFPNFKNIVNNQIPIIRPDGFAGRVGLFELETLFSPVLFLFYNREGAIIPIRRSFADELLGETPTQRSLLAPREAFLRVEKAYYRQPKHQKFLTVGCPVVFYVSGRAGGSSSAVGVGRVTSISTHHLDEIPIQFRRQGVLDEKELIDLSSKSGSVQVITFDNFKPFKQAISFSQLKKLNAVSGANLVTAQRLDRAALTRICETGLREIG